MAKNYVAAQSAINQAFAKAATRQNPEAWYYRGVIHKELYKASLRPADRDTAVLAYQRCLALPKNNPYLANCHTDLTYLATVLYNEGTFAFNTQDYPTALDRLRRYLTLQASHDSVAIQPDAHLYVGVAARQLGQPELAQQQFVLARRANCRSPQLYTQWASLCQHRGDTALALTTLRQGQALLPNEPTLAAAEASLLLATRQPGPASVILEKLVAQNPKNADQHLVLATAYQRLMKQTPDQREAYFAKAQQLYQRVTQLDTNSYQANYNLGVLTYNQGVYLSDQQGMSLDLAALDKTQEACLGWFKQALPYVERAAALRPRETAAWVALREIYQSLSRLDKIANVEAHLKALK